MRLSTVCFIGAGIALIGSGILIWSDVPLVYPAIWFALAVLDAALATLNRRGGN